MLFVHPVGIYIHVYIINSYKKKTVPSVSAFDPTVHLPWGDVAIDPGHPPSKIRVPLKRSKTDQFGRGVAVFLGATGDELCPVTAVVSFAALRGDAAGPFFSLPRWNSAN